MSPQSKFAPCPSSKPNPNPYPLQLPLPNPRQAWTPIYDPIRSKGIFGAFEAFGRTVVATGCSGRHARHTLLLTADYLSNPEEAKIFKCDLPTTHWFARQREAVGSEPFVYSCLELVTCSSILQWGFDETSLDGLPTFNQWCLVRRESGVTIITLECAGLLPSSTAAETVEHIAKTWERGRACVELVREELEPDLEDTLAPLMDGGLNCIKYLV
jgi:hypothetical protein